MKWLRFVFNNASAFGCVEGYDQGKNQGNSQGNNEGDTAALKVRVFSGDMFAKPIPTDILVDLQGLEILPPCAPSKMLALWNNFGAAATKNGWATPTEPLYFVKPSNTFSAHKRMVEKPRSYGGRVLYEAELGIVIGKAGKNIAIEDAAQHVFGYTCVNDVTALEILRADPSFEQWTRAKGFDGFAPFGPCIETEVDVASLTVKATVNGRERQNYPVADMFFSPLQLVSLLSRDVTLWPGDVISCGTSLGAGPWQADAEVQVIIDGIGTLANTLTNNLAT
jgi:2-keto-4-pentenoate hydratase/2-oxohepta-3-ene-1,7-dioic acid hydratase in catechol pathway